MVREILRSENMHLSCHRIRGHDRFILKSNILLLIAKRTDHRKENSSQYDQRQNRHTDDGNFTLSDTVPGVLHETDRRTGNSFHGRSVRTDHFKSIPADFSADVIRSVLRRFCRLHLFLLCHCAFTPFFLSV